jgi:hypothetical protein
MFFNYVSLFTYIGIQSLEIWLPFKKRENRCFKIVISCIVLARIFGGMGSQWCVFVQKSLLRDRKVPVPSPSLKFIKWNLMFMKYIRSLHTPDPDFAEGVFVRHYSTTSDQIQITPQIQQDIQAYRILQWTKEGNTTGNKYYPITVSCT